MNQQSIIKSCFLNHRVVMLDEHIIFEGDIKNNYNHFLKEIYLKLNCQYPKYYKMDALSKTAFFCSELLLQDMAIDTSLKGDKVGIFLTNRASSLESDENYFDKTFLDEKLSSNPTLFVYTLPNIMIGELSIRHGFKGEQCMWISEKLDTDFVANYVNLMFQNGIIDGCLVGWIDVYRKQECAFLSWITNIHVNSNSLPFNHDNLQKNFDYLMSM